MRLPAVALVLAVAVAGCSLALDLDRLRRDAGDSQGGAEEAGADADAPPLASVSCGTVRTGVVRRCALPSVCCVTDGQPRCTATDACDPAHTMACDEPSDCDRARPICCSRGIFPSVTTFCSAEGAAAQCDRLLCDPRANTCSGATPDCVSTTAFGAAGTFSKCEPHDD